MKVKSWQRGLLCQFLRPSNAGNKVASYRASFDVTLSKVQRWQRDPVFQLADQHPAHAHGGFFVTLSPSGRHDERLPDTELLRRFWGHSGHWPLLGPDAPVANDPMYGPAVRSKKILTSWW